MSTKHSNRISKRIRDITRREMDRTKPQRSNMNRHNCFETCLTPKQRKRSVIKSALGNSSWPSLA